MHIGIVGYGYVGRAQAALFGRFATISHYDTKPKWGFRSDAKRAINSADVAFVCVPTPIAPDGSCDTSIVEEAVDWLETDLIIIRSTIAPGTTDHLAQKTGKNIIFQPEYVGETPNHPLTGVAPEFIILGGSDGLCHKAAELYKKVLHSQTRFYFTSAAAAELCKYMENSFFAAKVIFCAEFHSIAEALGVSYDELRELWLADPRVNRDHTFVYPDSKGFSGKCLPKDVAAIIAASKKAAYNPQLLTKIMAINRAYREEDPTYEPYKDLPKAE